MEDMFVSTITGTAAGRKKEPNAKLVEHMRKSHSIVHWRSTNGKETCPAMPRPPKHKRPVRNRGI